MAESEAPVPRRLGKAPGSSTVLAMAVLLTYAPAWAARAHDVAQRLGELGFEVRAAPSPQALSPAERRKAATAIAAAKLVVVLWSHNAPPALRAMTKQAKRAGKLVVARLDAARPPVRSAYAIDLSRPDMRRGLRALQTALSGETRMNTIASPAIARTRRLEGIAATLLLALVTATAAYVADASFAARVDAVARDAQARTMALIGSKG
jgi:hypothetical protein